MTTKTPTNPAETTLNRLQQAQTRMQDGVSSAMKYWENSMAFCQSQLAAMVASSQIMAVGLQEISKHIAANSKEGIEETAAFTKSLLAAQSPQAAVQLQAGFIKASLAKGVAQNRELSQATAELAKQAARPINEHLAKSSKLRQK